MLSIKLIYIPHSENETHNLSSNFIIRVFMNTEKVHCKAGKNTKNHFKRDSICLKYKYPTKIGPFLVFTRNFPLNVFLEVSYIHGNNILLVSYSLAMEF